MIKPGLSYQPFHISSKQAKTMKSRVNENPECYIEGKEVKENQVIIPFQLKQVIQGNAITAF